MPIPQTPPAAFTSRIKHAGMTVGRQQLQSLQPERADQNEGGNQKYAPRVGQTER